MKLFKFLSAGVLMLGAVTVANAQEEASNKSSMAPSFGIKGGINFATVTSDDDDISDPESRTSFHAGVFGEFPVADIFSIQVEALYSGQGFEADFNGPDGDRAELQLDYINVPVLAKFYVVEGFSLEVGPQFSFLVNDEFDFNPNSNDGDIDFEGNPFAPDVETFEFGVAAGATLQLPIGLFATARYNRGLTDIVEDAKVKNSVFQIGVGYKF